MPTPTNITSRRPKKNEYTILMTLTTLECFRWNWRARRDSVTSGDPRKTSLQNQFARVYSRPNCHWQFSPSTPFWRVEDSSPLILQFMKPHKVAS
jgi:hypothetical protein